MARPKTLTMQYTVLFSQRTVQLPVENRQSVRHFHDHTSSLGSLLSGKMVHIILGFFQCF